MACNKAFTDTIEVSANTVKRDRRTRLEAWGECEKRCALIVQSSFFIATEVSHVRGYPQLYWRPRKTAWMFPRCHMLDKTVSRATKPPILFTITVPYANGLWFFWFTELTIEKYEKRNKADHE